jgi:hypothetical protein
VREPVRASGRSCRLNVEMLNVRASALAFYTHVSQKTTALGRQRLPRLHCGSGPGGNVPLPLASICRKKQPRAGLATAPQRPTLLHNHHIRFFLVRPASACGSIVERIWCFRPLRDSPLVTLDVRPPPKEAERIRTNRSHGFPEPRRPHGDRSKRQYPWYRRLSRARHHVHQFGCTSAPAKQPNLHGLSTRQQPTLGRVNSSP